MVLEAVLYFILGFFSAGLLALMISPAIWNRAVVLTRQKIESSVPLTLNEVQADKDQLRAEFAMSTRRLEISIDELREKASMQLIEINKKRDEAAKYQEDAKERLATITELETKANNLRTKLSEREARLEEITAKRATLEEQYAETSGQLNEMRRRLSDSEEELAGKRIELVAKESKIDGMMESMTEVDIGDDEKLARLQEFRLKLANTEEKLNAEKRHAKEVKEELREARQELKEINTKLQNREYDLNESRINNGSDSSDIMDLNQQLIEEKSKIVELEAKLAKQTIQTEALLNDASNENVQAVMQTINKDIEEKTGNLKEIEAERDELRDKLNMLSINAGSNWSDERQENALLRERINDMAAHVAAMTAQIEGKESPINDILKSEPAAPKLADDEDEGGNSTVSLAARIRAIQQAASSDR